ncbi:His-Xaa-Ser system protein HxsD [Luteimonas sp. RD2P54]|uniref:His-Xaa-Ser system protein HxsD n=1 Tax=Luteimonas endophytica TaxID=3042023 RepID=A0ABT6JDV0_9GAMM|nr:His-Xaa-Ser system protein HxsD [Luteimonas endophytica]MDH5824961.1 His-Xaa-Ser system protein HxsD [Luteimonas endophytica]
MSSHELRLDRTLFSDDVVSKAAHRYSSDFFVEIQVEGTSTVVRLTPKNNVADQLRVLERFHNDVLDERLRDVVKNETADLQVILIKAALSESLSRRDGSSK